MTAAVTVPDEHVRTPAVFVVELFVPSEARELRGRCIDTTGTRLPTSSAPIGICWRKFGPARAGSDGRYPTLAAAESLDKAIRQFNESGLLCCNGLRAVSAIRLRGERH
jgi:hypothetical protein